MYKVGRVWMWRAQKLMQNLSSKLRSWERHFTVFGNNLILGSRYPNFSPFCSDREIEWFLCYTYSRLSNLSFTETESKSGIISKPIKVPTATLTAPPTAPETRATESNSNQKVRISAEKNLAYTKLECFLKYIFCLTWNSLSYLSLAAISHDSGSFFREFNSASDSRDSGSFFREFNSASDASTSGFRTQGNTHQSWYSVSVIISERKSGTF